MAQPNTRLTQSDMKRTRNFTQNDDQFEEKLPCNNNTDSQSHHNGL